jgi:Oxidoreductase family, NAD-binding Rossmann fold
MKQRQPASGIDRREFLSQSGRIAAGTALATTALSYGRILGANDRIALGHIGVGNRGRGLDSIVAKLKDQHNVEMTAVCDLWTVNREKAVEAARTVYGRAPRACANAEELLALKDVDAVLIATPEHSHSPLLKMTAEAGKDAYCEKPMGNDLSDLKAARSAVVAQKRVVQIGTQHRSELYPRAAHDLVRTGVLGEVSKVEIVWNFHGPRWRGRPEVKQIREQDTDWRRWLMNRPARAFDPQLYFEYRLYKDFSSGIPDQWMSHGIDLVQHRSELYPRAAHDLVRAGVPICTTRFCATTALRAALRSERSLPIRLLAVRVLAGFDRHLQQRRMRMLRRGDEHGIDVLQGQQLLGVGAGPRGATVRRPRRVDGLVAVDRPQIAHGGHLHVVLIFQLRYDRVEAAAAIADAEMSQRDAVVGAKNPPVRQRRRRDGRPRCHSGALAQEFAPIDTCPRG